jgi:hypothetical protein
MYSKDHDTINKICDIEKNKKNKKGSRYSLSLTNQRSCFEVRRLQHHQQIKAHGQHMVNKT